MILKFRTSSAITFLIVACTLIISCIPQEHPQKEEASPIFRNSAGNSVEDFKALDAVFGNFYNLAPNTKYDIQILFIMIKLSFIFLFLLII